MRKAVIVLPGYADHGAETAAMADLGLTTELLDWGGDPERLARGLAEAEIVFVRDTRLDGRTIGAMARARGIVRYGVGTDNLDLTAAAARGIVVARVPNYGAEVEVADHSLALFLAARRRIAARDGQVRAGGWLVGQREPIPRIAGSVAGLVGFGRIGQAVAHRLRAFGIARFLIHDPYLPAERCPADGTMVGLADLARGADAVFLHAPATAENHHLVGPAFLAAMRPGAVLINTGRGALVDAQALAAALHQGGILAGIDVFEHEPPIGNPLLTAPGVVLSDHTAWYSETTVANLQAGAIEQARQILLTGTASERVI